MRSDTPSGAETFVAATYEDLSGKQFSQQFKLTSRSRHGEIVWETVTEPEPTSV
jgi:hypothetical protein